MGKLSDILEIKEGSKFQGNFPKLENWEENKYIETSSLVDTTVTESCSRLKIRKKGQKNLWHCGPF